jgi:hypothetical protein
MKQNLPIFENYHVFRYSMVAMLQKMKGACQTLTTFNVQPILRGMIKSLALDVIYDTKPGGFKVIRKWTHQFIKHYMNWTFRASITIVSKLPAVWQKKGKFMAYCVAYLARAYDIPLHLLSIMIKLKSI